MLLSPAAGLADVLGFTGSFSPSTWLVVNTNPDQKLNGINNSADSTLCSTSPSVGELGPNEVACIEKYEAGTGELALLSSWADYPGGGTIADDPRTTRFTLTNPYPSDYEYRRVYLITFNWSFTGNSLADQNPTGSQFLSIRVTGGSVYTDNQENYEFITTPGLAYNNIPATVYLPMGATLDFTISTNNSDDPAVLSLTGFDYVEIPAPLPISGATMFFATSRRLRRRRRSAQLPLLRAPGSTCSAPPSPKVLRALKAEQQKRQAIKRYAALLEHPLPPASQVAPVRSSSSESSDLSQRA